MKQCAYAVENWNSTKLRNFSQVHMASKESWGWDNHQSESQAILFSANDRHDSSSDYC
jgi:hypothetical protein